MEKNIIDEKDKILLRMEAIIGLSTIIMYLLLIMTISIINIEEYIKVLIILFLTFYLIVIAFVLLKIEQIAGYYKCRECGHKYVPSYLKVFYAMHIGRTRYMKCPKCNKRSWQKKVISK